MDKLDEKEVDSTRRQFLKNIAVFGAGVTMTGQALNANATTNEIPRRPFGKTGVEVSILGIGGYSLGEVKVESEAIEIVHRAIDAGINFMDNAWEYHDGRSEEWMGKALKGRRDKAFLMTKVCTHGRKKDVAMQQLEQSLKRLQTDHLDLWQIHEVIYDNDPDLHFAAGGVVEALEEAKKQGKVRFVGFTGHKDPGIHLKMLSHDFPFDSCQLPLGVFDASFRSFEQKVLPELNRREIAVIGMKSLGGTGEAIKAGVITVEEALRYVLSLPVATLVSGIDSIGVFNQNVGIVRAFKPLQAQEMNEIRKKTAQYAADGRYELYKTSKRFDGPPGREQHGFPPPEKIPT
jgi:aryl-alcohol dehydrogenase-like predicted oxidoreductase